MVTVKKFVDAVEARIDPVEFGKVCKMARNGDMAFGRTSGEWGPVDHCGYRG